jgi:hypothetical protein
MKMNFKELENYINKIKLREKEQEKIEKIEREKTLKKIKTEKTQHKIEVKKYNKTKKLWQQKRKIKTNNFTGFIVLSEIIKKAQKNKVYQKMKKK